MTRTIEKRWWSSSLGTVELEIPVEAIGECSHQGQCDEDIAYWYKQIDFSGVTHKDLVMACAETGGWERDELDNETTDTLRQRVCWIACCDLAEEMYLEKTREDQP